jgi:hypothetical protein
VKSTSWLALATLLAIGGFVVLSSLRVAGVRCEICVEFDGARACRTVDGANEKDALAAARTNACAQLTSGVTNSMRCERQEPLSSTCSRR